MEWYYANDGQRTGPVTPETFALRVREGTVHAETLVWRPGMSEWLPWAEVQPTVQLPPLHAEPPPLASEPPFAVEAVEREGPELEFGGFWLRFVAKLVDWIIVGVAGNFVLAAILGGRMAEMQAMDPEDPAALGLAMTVLGQAFLVGLVLGLIYHWFFLAKYAATPGKLMLGLRVVRGDGSRLSHGRIVARYFAEYVSSFILYIGYLIAAFDDEKRTVHDYICDTRVIKKPRD